MIVIVGHPAWRATEPAGPGGRASAVALAAAARGAQVQIVGRVGEDPIGEALLLALARAGIGHAAVLRDPSRPTAVVVAAPSPAASDEESPWADEGSASAEAGPAEPGPDRRGPRLEAADVDLGIRYLEPSGVLVVTDDVDDDVLAAAVEGARYAGTRLVMLVGSGRAVPADVPSDATVLAVPDEDDGAFDALVGTYAAALDRGDDPAAAFAAAQGVTGWEPAAVD